MAPVVKIIIAGGRDVTDPNVVFDALIASLWWEKHLLGEIIIEVVCGMAPGADTLGRLFAEKNGIKVHKFPAAWHLHGRKAGPLRNIEMGNFADALVAVWDGQSKGTEHMIKYAKKKGLEVYVHRVEPVLKENNPEPIQRKGL